MSSILLKNGLLINEGFSVEGDCLIRNGRLEKIGGIIEHPSALEIDVSGKWVLPGVIDDQVHFREPGYTHKANIASESKAALAGGITSFMEMPNTLPAAVTRELLEEKYEIGRKTSWTNYSFFLGASNNNLEEALRTDPSQVCGLKIFMGSSTGDLLVDDEAALEGFFREVPYLIATHCEDEPSIRANMALFRERYGEDVLPDMHPRIRNERVCYLSSAKACGMARKYGTRLHILHISTAKEVNQFENQLPLQEKRITSEACVHHLWFNEADYVRLGNQIKCNPAIKSEYDREAVFQAVLDDRIDIIATDHAPHTWEEKSREYAKAPSGLPLVQHSLNMMVHFHHLGRISKEKIVEKMCHAPADCFRVRERGYLREGYFADVVVFDPESAWTVHQENLLYHCGWSPLEGTTFKGRVEMTWINGVLQYDKGNFYQQHAGSRLAFEARR